MLNSVNGIVPQFMTPLVGVAFKLLYTKNIIVLLSCTCIICIVLYCIVLNGLYYLYCIVLHWMVCIICIVWFVLFYCIVLYCLYCTMQFTFVYWYRYISALHISCERSQRYQQFGTLIDLLIYCIVLYRIIWYRTELYCIVIVIVGDCVYQDGQNATTNNPNPLTKPNIIFIIQVIQKKT